ncbi:hypothetical protein ABRZ24_10810 [Brenneria populi]|uniref:Uracil-DNA glycosylase-like domain-containing protein n=1 Tax=Brenneria populi TaxID=1505588 RepID=A0ABU6JQQ1_9GAMM|nr:hypothetical protein [Brenneria populi Li et al. 2015]
MHINSYLKALYEANWPALLENGRQIAGPAPTNPLLLCFNEAEFLQANKRILICGQETWGWGAFGATVEDCMAGYRRFFIDGAFYDGYGVSAFWKAFRFFESQLVRILGGQQLQFIWQNLAKIGRNDGKTGVTDEIRTLERAYFPVFKAEMKLLKPDIVLFLTGPDRDLDIRFHFPDAVFSQAGDESNLRRRAWVSSAELPAASLRLYHPRYFGAWSHQYKNEVVSLLKSRF